MIKMQKVGTCALLQEKEGNFFKKPGIYGKNEPIWKAAIATVRHVPGG